MIFKTKPMEHQYALFDKIKDMPYHAIGWDTGTGKTKEAIDLIRYHFLKNNGPMRVLILAPIIALDVWKQEIKKHSNIPENMVAKVRGTSQQKYAKLKNKSNYIFLVNYEGIVSIQDELMKMDFDICIADESHYIKNPKAGCTKALLEFSDSIRYKYILSGTMILNSPQDIYSQYRFIDNGERFGRSFSIFRKVYFEEEMPFLKKKLKENYYPKYVLKSYMKNKFESKMHSCLDVKTKFECLDLPEVVYQEYSVELTNEQIKMYNELRKEAISLIDGFEEVVIAERAATLLIKLHQICTGFYKTNLGNEEHFAPNPKIKAIKELLEGIAPQSKVIIWACYRSNIKQLFEELKEYNPAILYGDIAVADREKEVIKFKTDPKCRVMIANPMVASESVTLTESNYAIYYSQNFNLKYRLQSEGRCLRKGSEVHTKVTYIDLVIKGTIDEVIYEALKNKENMANDLLRIIKKL